MTNYYFTSESVTSGHPDKVCDYISDSILDAAIKEDKNSRVACETSISKDTLFIFGEISTKAKLDYEKIAKEALREIGYSTKGSGFDVENCKVIIGIQEQSSDIAQGVNSSYDDTNTLGAGDQGIMFGYACDETEELMPLPISLAHKLAKKLEKTRKNNVLDYLMPDGKTQVTIEYENDMPKRIDTIVVSTQHKDTISTEQLRKDVYEKVILDTVPNNMIDKNTKIFINPTGRFVIGGPESDSGLTGRKIIVDTYGGYARHGGGAFSGKDPTKVDRSAAYMARYTAKNIVKAKLAKKCEIQLSYAIGVSKPVSIYINTFGTNTVPEEKILSAVNHIFDFTPEGIINTLNLRTPIYSSLAHYGHIGREDLDVTFERTDKVYDIINYIQNN
ncbi:MAG: methionine adenosyltransferase [Clostridia bacterium]